MTSAGAGRIFQMHEYYTSLGFYQAGHRVRTPAPMTLTPLSDVEYVMLHEAEGTL